MRRLPRKCDGRETVMAQKQHSILLVAILTLLMMPAMVAEAACWGWNNRTGKRQAVREVYTSTATGLIAESKYSPSGQPLIIYYRRYRGLSSLFRRFTRAHECCHHATRGMNTSEVAANCCAIRRMRLSPAQAERIKRRWPCP